jgi:virginiamycin B lyase
LWFGIIGSPQTMAGRLAPTGAVSIFPPPNGFEGGAGMASEAGALFTVTFSTTEITASGLGAAYMARMTPSGVVTQVTALGIGAVPNNIAVGPDGNLWFPYCESPCLFYPGAVGIVSPNGSLKTPVTLPANYFGIFLAAGRDHSLYLTATTENPSPFQADSVVFELSTSGAVVKKFTLPNGSGASGIAVKSDGSIWVAESGAGKIARLTASGRLTEFALQNNRAAPFNIVVGNDGALWFTEFAGNALGRISPAGVITEYPVTIGVGGPEEILSCSVSCGNPRGVIWFTQHSGIGKFVFEKQ